MGNKYLILRFLILFALLFECNFGFGQDEQVYTQSILKQEFLNPAYNSFKDYSSVSLLSREQWNNAVVGSPKTNAASLYCPLKLSGLGIGFVAISEEIGLRDKLSFSGTLSHNVKITSKSYLAFGYGVGFEKTSYDLQRMITQNEDIEIRDLDLDYTRMSFTLGLFYYSTHFFSGISSNALAASKKSNSGWLLPGFDFTLGSMHEINKKILFRPDLAIKYYNVKDIVYTDGVKEVSYYSSVFDLSLNFLLDNRLWIGTGRRFNQAQTFSVDLIIHKELKLGYTYELGFGKGLNQFDSQGIRLVWNFIPNPAKESFRSGKKYSAGNIGTNLYK